MVRNFWHDIPITTSTAKEFVFAVIEIPEGCSNKFEYDKDYGIMRLDRVLFTSTHYPANYGFVPRTLSDDGDPLDIFVFSKDPMVPNVLMRARPVGVFIMVDGDEIDEKIISVCADDPSYKDIHDIDQLQPHIINEMTHFLEVYKELEGKKTKVMKTKNRDHALIIIEKCKGMYDKKYPTE